MAPGRVASVVGWNAVALTAAIAASTGCTTDPDPCEVSGTACTWAGTGVRGFNVENPTADRLASKLYFPADLTFGPDGRGYIADYNNHRVRRVEADDSLRTVVGTDYEGDGPPEMQDRLPVCHPTGAPGTTVAMNHVTDVKFGPDGKLYIASWHNNKLRVYDPATELVTAIAGDGYGFKGDGGPACHALFNQPKTIAIAPDGTLYTIDQRNVRIRKIAPDGDRTITTIAGVGTKGNLGDGGLAIDAQFGFDTGTTPQPSGALVLVGRTMYVADSLNNRIRRIDLDTGVVDCIAGSSAVAGYSGDGGPAIDATFDFPMDMELGPDGRLYVADRNNNAVRAIDLTTGRVETVAGGVQCKLSDGKCADHVPALQLGLNEPYGIAFDGPGNLYIADTYNNRIVKVTR